MFPKKGLASDNRQRCIATLVKGTNYWAVLSIQTWLDEAAAWTAYMYEYERS